MSEKIFVIDLSTQTTEMLPYSYEPGGMYGRGLAFDLIRKYVPGDAGRFSPDNAIVIAPGLFTGNPAPSACRTFVATSEAEDKGMQICNTTGDLPQKLGSLGIAAVVIKGKSSDPGAVIHIDKDGVSFAHDESLPDRQVSEIVGKLRADYSRSSAIIGTGKAGDMRMDLSSFFCTYPAGIPEYHCPRNGFGDVWGSKNLKAVVVDSDDIFARECNDPGRFREAGRKLTQLIINDEICGGALPSYGSITIMKILKSGKSLKELGSMTGTEKGTEDKDSSEGVHINRTCAPMCVIGCLNRHVSSDGRRYSSPSQVETQAAIEKCFGLDSYDLADAVQTRANEIGIAATEFVTACKTYAEAAGISDPQDHLIEWLEEIERGSLTGRVIASRTYGVARLYADKDLSGWVDRKAVMDEDLFSVRMSKHYESLAGMNDLELMYAQIFVLENLGICIFTAFALLDKIESFELLAEMFEARTGLPMTGEMLIRQANQCMQEEREYTEQRWKKAQRNNIPPFTKVLYRYYDSKASADEEGLSKADDE